MKDHPIGTRVRINCPESRHHGTECTVISPGFVTDISHRGVVKWRDKYVQKVDLPVRVMPGRIQPYSVWKPEWLVPVYDGNEVVAWADCAWKPRTVHA